MVTAPVSALSTLRDPATLAENIKPAARHAVALTAKSPDLGPARTDSVPLPIAGFDTIVVDDAHQHVFISGGDGSTTGLSTNGILVTDFSGNVLSTLETDGMVDGLVLDPANGVLYAALYTDDAVARIDLATLAETQRWPSLGGILPQSLAVVDGKAWYTAVQDLVFSIDLTTGTFVDTGLAASHLAAVPGHPTWLAYATERGSGHQDDIADVSSNPPTVYSTSGPTAQSDLAVSSDGSFLLAGGLGVAFNATASLDQAFTFTPVSTTGSVATQDGTYAVGTSAVGGVNLSVYRFGSATATSQFSLIPGPVPHGLAYSQDGKSLFAVLDDASGFSLVREDRVDLIGTKISLTLPHRLAVGTGATASGTVSFTNQPYDGTVRTLQVSRTDSTGTHSLPSVTTDTTGKFSFTDSATTLGKVTYSVTYAGDAAHGPFTQTAVGLREVALDINGDGHADLAVGSPGEDIGTVANTGDLTILFGSASGVTGTGAKEYDLSTPGVVAGGRLRAIAQFGWSQVSGDFNGDGYQDLAVSANAQNNVFWDHGGGVWIFYGSASGLRTDNVTSFDTGSFDQNDGIDYTDAFVGEVMTAGDFDGDGIDDLATTVFGSHEEVSVMYGTTSGLDTSPHLIQGDSVAFGASLSAGDINGDGRADLAIGGPLDVADKGYYAGAVSIYYGSPTGLTTTGSQKFNKDTTGVPGSVKPFTTDLPDEFGFQVDLADFNGDGRADLAASAPGSPVTYSGSVHQDAGTVTVLYSASGKISTTNSVEVTQATAGMPGSPGKNDQMGSSMATGDSNGDGKADLVEFSPGDHYVTVIKGASSGLSFSTAVAWTQNSTGIPGTDEAGDGWGDSLRFGNFKASTGPQALAVGADGENSGQGSVTVIYGTTSGLTGTGSVAFSQNSTGIPGTSENGDMFGSFFSF